MELNERLLMLAIALPALVAGLTVHEFAHAWAAFKLGDTTAQRQGRLTLDPLKHLDPLGSIFMLLSALGGFFFGWAKPVPFDPRFMRHPKRDAMLVAIAGPISNILQIPIWMAVVALISRLMPDSLSGEAGSLPVMLLQMARLGVIINLTLAVFNMIPLPPLDGHYVLEFFGGEPVTRAFEALRPYSFMLLLVIINLPAPFNFVRQILRPVSTFANQLVVWSATGQWF